MFGFQTVSCLHNIPGNEVTRCNHPEFSSRPSLRVVVRSSTNKIQDVYAKAKDSSILIRLPCQLAETVADTSMKIALTVADPLVKPFRGPGKESLADFQCLDFLPSDQHASSMISQLEQFVKSERNSP